MYANMPYMECLGTENWRRSEFRCPANELCPNPTKPGRWTMSGDQHEFSASDPQPYGCVLKYGDLPKTPWKKGHKKTLWLDASPLNSTACSIQPKRPKRREYTHGVHDHTRSPQTCDGVWLRGPTRCAYSCIDSWAGVTPGYTIYVRTSTPKGSMVYFSLSFTLFNIYYNIHHTQVTGNLGDPSCPCRRRRFLLPAHRQMSIGSSRKPRC